MPPKRKGKSRKPKAAAASTSKKAPMDDSELMPKTKSPDKHLNLEEISEKGTSWTQMTQTSMGTLLSAFYAIERNPYLTVKEPSRAFIRSKTGLLASEETEWRLKRFLGAGSNGRVALWEKVDTKTGTQIDEVAIKEIDQWLRADENIPGLPREVAINRDLNVHDTTNIAYLRAFKYGQTTKRGRMFMRAYKTGDLCYLIDLYKIYGYYLPEWFVLKSLLQLCTSLDALAQVPPADTKFSRWAEQGDEKPDHDALQTIYADWKPENTLLGDSNTDGGSIAPTVVLADYGNSDYIATGETDYNPEYLARAGTAGYHAPENRHEIWHRDRDTIVDSLNSNYYKFQRQSMVAQAKDSEIGTRQTDGQELLVTPNNVYGVGRIVFDLMMPMGVNDFGRILRLNEGFDTPDYAGLMNMFGNYYIAGKPLPKNAAEISKYYGVIVGERAAADFPYSDELVALLSEMLHPEQGKRPSIKAVRDQAQDLLDEAMEQVERARSQKPRKKATKNAASKKENSNEDDQPGSRPAWAIDPKDWHRLLFMPEHFTRVEQNDRFVIEEPTRPAGGFPENETPAQLEAWEEEKREYMKARLIYDWWTTEAWGRADGIKNRWDPEHPLPMQPDWYRWEDTDGESSRWFRENPVKAYGLEVEVWNPSHEQAQGSEAEAPGDHQAETTDVPPPKTGKAGDRGRKRGQDKVSASDDESDYEDAPVKKVPKKPQAPAKNGKKTKTNQSTQAAPAGNRKSGRLAGKAAPDLHL